MRRIISIYSLMFTSMYLLSSCASTPTSESTGQLIDNSAITAKVKAALLNDPNVSSYPIKVKTYKGTVQLSGFVDNTTQAKRAENVARSVRGVQAVENDLLVKTK